MLAMSAMLLGSLAAASLAAGKADCAGSGAGSRADCAIAIAGTVRPAVTSNFAADGSVPGTTGGADAGGCGEGAVGATWHAVRFDFFVRLGCLHGRRSTWIMSVEQSAAHCVTRGMGLSRHGSQKLLDAQLTMQSQHD